MEWLKGDQIASYSLMVLPAAELSVPSRSLPQCLRTDNCCIKGFDAIDETSLDRDVRWYIAIGPEVTDHLISID